MKKRLNKIYLLFGFGALIATSGCSDFLDRQPIDKFTNDEYWTSEGNVRTYAWNLYNEFLGYGNGTGTTSEFYFQSSSASGCANISDDLDNNSFLTLQSTSSTTSSEWTNYYSTIRSTNLMLQKLPQVPMTAAAVKHWDGVARFFRAFTYFRLVQRYGDVPYVNKCVGAKDASNIYVKRTSRNVVMDSVKADLEKAITELYPNDGGATTINKYTAYALLCRVGLYEGTYRKYQNLGDGTEFLKAAKNAALEIFNSKAYALGTDFKAAYNSTDLSTNKEMILYKKYLPSVLGHSLLSYTNSSTTLNGMTKAAIESYACADGLPIGQSSLYKGDKSLTNVVASRDKRLVAALDTNGYGYTDKALYGVITSSTGYVISLFNNFDPKIRPLASDVVTGGQNHTDAPVFGLAEVMLNYAEACAELGSCTQADLDISVNLLRKRAGLPDLTIVGADNVTVNGVLINDPKRTADLEKVSGSTEVSPLIWEIRRDRRAELMAWTYIRYYDLMRWHRGQYLDFTNNPDVALGARLVGVSTTKTRLNPDGYIIPYASSAVRTFVSPKHYLNSIPLNDISLYAAEGIELTQNPGWNK